MKLITLFEDFKNQKPVNEQSFWGTLAAGYMPVCPSTGRVLMAYRSAHVNEPHTWATIGGKLDIDEGVDESIEEAALRELQEETEYYGDIRSIKTFVFRKGSFEYHNHYGVVPTEFEAQRNWENDRFVWMTTQEVRELPKKHFGLIDLLRDEEAMRTLAELLNEEYEAYIHDAPTTPVEGGGTYTHHEKENEEGEENNFYEDNE